MEQRDGLVMHMLDAVRLCFDCARQQAGDDMNLHPRQGPVLGMLLKRDGISQAELARMLHVTAATVAVSVARLEKLGYVRREKNEHNQRANVLKLTDEGRHEAQRMQNVMQQVRDVALDGFSPEELKQMERICLRMIDNLYAQYRIGEEKVMKCTKC